MKQRVERVVCIKTGTWRDGYGNINQDLTDPVKGDIDIIVRVIEFNGRTYYELADRPTGVYNAVNFRPVDYSTGEIVASWIESVGFKQVQLEEAFK